MNITKTDSDALNSTIKLQIEKKDYETRVDKILKDHRKKVNINGFRQGMAPMGMVKNMYGTSVLVEEINKILSEELSKYLVDSKLNVLGEPLPSETDQKPIDWETQSDFEFVFDIAIAPEFEVDVSKKDKVPYYTIKVDDKLLDSYIENYAKKFGRYAPSDVVEENELLKGTLVELNDNGDIKEGGVLTQEATISTEYIKDEESKKSVMGKKVGESIDLDVRKAFPNDTEIAAMLKIKKEELANVGSNFKLTIQEVLKFEASEINQDLFDKVYGKDEVKSVEEFKLKITDEIRENMVFESEYKMQLDIREKLAAKIKMDLPSEFLKRWLLAVNEKLTKEDIDKDYPAFEKDLRWQLVRNKLIRDNEIKAEEAEVVAEAKKFTLMQFKQYGMANVPDEQLEQYAMEILKKQEEANKLYERVLEDKVFSMLKEQIKLDEKEVTTDEFQKLFAS